MKAQAISIGSLLTTLGIMSFLLPLIGLQLHLIQLFGNAQPTVGLVLIGLGVLCCIRALFLPEDPPGKP